MFKGLGLRVQYGVYDWGNIGAMDEIGNYYILKVYIGVTVPLK